MSKKERLEAEAIKTGEKTWCKISNSGKLEYLDWTYINKTAEAFDAAGEAGARDQMMTMCKLMTLVRQQTIEKAMIFMERLAESDNDTPALIAYDPVNQELPPAATFVFFHVGDDVSSPSKLVDSITKSNEGAEIIMCTDPDTPHIEGVKRVEAAVNRNHLMSERWKAFASLQLDYPAIYLDTDMVVRGRINIPAILGTKKYVFCLRSFNKMAPFNGRQRGLDFPEHEGRPIGLVYPILACFTVTASSEQWAVLYDLITKLEEKYLVWYGDQEVLRDFIDTLKVQDFNFVDESLFGCLPEYADKNSPFIVHYKGNRKNATT